ncbi:NepR family anti-sigma factor [Pelagerythrobacter marensis]|uniref:NepR family anti-sigma factor n=1 Tax=Pelagerythrobacter marensis TaxID=543877 RepID=A0ABZ2D5S3_9SPHN
MHIDGDRRAGETGKGESKIGKRDNPGWADGLRQLYDSVVEEPLPDSFKELLSKLDEKS